MQCRSLVALIALVGCGSSTAPPPSTGPRVASVDEEARAERARRAKLAAAHHALEDEQQTALGATCEDRDAPAKPRCEPTCYVPEPPDARASAKRLGKVAIAHLACRAADDATAMIVLRDDAAPQLAVTPAPRRVPRPARKGTPEAEVEAAIAAVLKPELVRGDAIRVTGAWRAVTHATTGEALRCIPIAHHTTLRRPLDACGGRGAIACEAGGNDAAHGLAVIRVRLVEARGFEQRGDTAGCQRASLEAFAVARGMPRWRQYASLNVRGWKAAPRYRTRFDGLLDEDALFTRAIALGEEARALHAACGGAPNPKTTAAQEQSFHTCW